MSDDDLVERLRICAREREDGDPVTDHSIALMREAAIAIERLRSLAGKADVGPGFADIKRGVTNRCVDVPAAPNADDAS